MKYLIRFGSNSNWEEIDLNEDGLNVAKRSGYDVVKIGEEPIHCKNTGDVGIVMSSIAKSMRNMPAWWGCRNCDYEEMVDKVPMPDDGLCLDCRDKVYNSIAGEA